jgi:anti-anti-sigma factor
MTITEDRSRGVVVVAPLDAHLVELSKAGNDRVVVDLSGVDYISSAGLRVMLTLAKRVRDRKGALALTGLEDAVRQVFELAGFLPLFRIEATRDAAVARTAAGS